MYLCQPVDVEIVCSIKHAMCKKWEDWMLDGKSIVNGMAKEPSHQLVAEWLATLYSNIPGKMVRKAWMKMGFE